MLVRTKDWIMVSIVAKEKGSSFGERKGPRCPCEGKKRAGAVEEGREGRERERERGKRDVKFACEFVSRKNPQSLDLQGPIYPL